MTTMQSNRRFFVRVELGLEKRVAVFRFKHIENSVNAALLQTAVPRKEKVQTLLYPCLLSARSFSRVSASRVAQATGSFA